MKEKLWFMRRGVDGGNSSDRDVELGVEAMMDACLSQLMHIEPGLE